MSQPVVYGKRDGKESYLIRGKTQLFITPGTAEPTEPKLNAWPEL